MWISLTIQCKWYECCPEKDTINNLNVHYLAKQLRYSGYRGGMEAISGRLLFEPTCANARWALMRRFPSVHLSVCPSVRLSVCRYTKSH